MPSLCMIRAFVESMLNWALMDGALLLKSQHSEVHLLIGKYSHTEIFLPVPINA